VRVLPGIAAFALAFGTLQLWAASVMPNFRLVDENPNSARHGSKVSPRDYLLQVSGYYFGDAG
jgi:hypothetical protein